MTEITSDELTLRQLNEQYLRAFMTADVAWYARHLSDDFICRHSDGRVLPKAAFLESVAQGPDIVELRLTRLRVRLAGDTATVDGTATFVRVDRTEGTSRYTDVYRRTGGEWKAVAAEVSRSARGSTSTHSS